MYNKEKNQGKIWLRKFGKNVINILKLFYNFYKKIFALNYYKKNICIKNFKTITPMEIVLLSEFGLTKISTKTVYINTRKALKIIDLD